MSIYLRGGGASPSLDPKERWIGYGIVMDLDGDRVADRRIGMDNALAEFRREWVTNLATGETDVNTGPSYGFVGLDTSFDTYYPGESFRIGDAKIIFSQQCGELGSRFYVWASMIADGAVVTDYLPDEGWIHHVPGRWDE